MGRALVAAALVPLLALTIVFSGGGGADEEPVVAGVGGTISGVPSQYVAAVMRAGSLCPEEVDASVIAAQLWVESKFDPSAASHVGAEGIAQFIPSTWADFGTDGDGDGVADVWNPQDAIYSQAVYMCHLAQTVRGYLDSGVAAGDPLALTLAAYNAGPGAVQKYGGIPPYADTQAYVPLIVGKMDDFVVQEASVTGTAAEQAADGLVNGSTVDRASFPVEQMSVGDPTPGAHSIALVTPRMYTLATAIMATYPAIAAMPALYCYDEHSWNPASDHSRGRACDLPFYGCTWVNAARSEDPATGLRAGNAAANWLVANAGLYGINYVIWQGQMWRASTGTWGPYDGGGGYDPTTCGGGHYDHIHVSVF